jgi:RNA polymerase sigma-70 factor (ECF subfamily)
LINDEELIRRCQQNDRSAQKVLFEKYANKMMATCMRYCKNQEDAKDLLHEGFYKVLTKIDKFKGNSKIDTWMTRIFINLALNKTREGRYKYNHYEYDPKLEQPSEDEPEDSRQVEAHEVLKALKELPEKYRLVLNMYAVDGMSHKEIASKLGISVGSSKSRLSRGRVMLNALLKTKKRL